MDIAQLIWINTIVLVVIVILVLVFLFGIPRALRKTAEAVGVSKTQRVTVRDFWQRNWPKSFRPPPQLTVGGPARVPFAPLPDGFDIGR